MFSALKSFLRREDGAVTVDYMVMCAAITVLCLGALQNVQGGVGNLAHALEQGISTKSISSN